MKGTPSLGTVVILSFVFVALPTFGQSIALQREVYEAARIAERQREELEWTGRTIGPWYGDPNWQQATNMIGKLGVGIERNRKELQLLEQANSGNGLSGQTNQAQVARAMQLRAFLKNQAAAIKKIEGQKLAIEAKYKLRDMKAEGVPPK